MNELAKLVWITPDAEEVIAYCARVSSPKSDEEKKENAEGLLRYCIRNSHWSIFEMASMCVEINTSRSIARQILRHRSFSFQEFSQRYAVMDMDPIYSTPRRQDTKNRQNSIDDLDDETLQWFIDAQTDLMDLALQYYDIAISDHDIAKECARALLPEGLTPSRMYMTGTIRSWLHYLDLRTGHGTQLEHVEVANAIKHIFTGQLPTIGGLIDE